MELHVKKDAQYYEKNKLHQMNRCQLQELLSDSLAALRAMAIDNDIVQNMLKRQKLMIEKKNSGSAAGVDTRAFLILDDCL